MTTPEDLADDTADEIEPPRRAAPRRDHVALKWTIGIALGVAFTWLTARNWPLDRLFSGSLSLDNDASGALAVVLRDDLGTTNWSLRLSALGAYLVVLFGVHWLRVLRWRPMLAAFDDVPLRVINRVGAAGFMSVFMLPLRLGELVRPWLISRNSNIPFGTALSTIAVERVIDGLMVTLLLFTVLMQASPTQLERHPEVMIGAWAALGVFGSAMAVLVATALARTWTTNLMRKLIGIVSGKLADKIVGLATSFVDGLKVLRSPAALVEFLALTMGYWALNGFGFWLMAQGFSIDAPVVGGYAMMCCVVVGMMIPNSPGNVGSFWYFMLLPSGLYGIDAGASNVIGLALGLWFVLTLQVTAFGLWGLWMEARAGRRSRSG